MIYTTGKISHSLFSNLVLLNLLKVATCGKSSMIEVAQQQLTNCSSLTGFIDYSKEG